jgi:hypothetical protein
MTELILSTEQRDSGVYLLFEQDDRGLDKFDWQRLRDAEAETLKIFPHLFASPITRQHAKCSRAKMSRVWYRGEAEQYIGVLAQALSYTPGLIIDGKKLLADCKHDSYMPIETVKIKPMSLKKKRRIKKADIAKMNGTEAFEAMSRTTTDHGALFIFTNWWATHKNRAETLDIMFKSA